jgi:hypothetical protein
MKEENKQRKDATYIVHHGTCLLRSMVKSEVENIMEAEIGGLVMVVRVFVLMMNFFG